MARIRKQAAEKQPAQITWRVAAYIRLSREDGLLREGGKDASESVVNQKKILAEFLEQSFEGPFALMDFYIDDGLSGTDDSRAGFLRIIQDIETGRVNCVVCKTLSRAFRNYADQGYYLEYYFPQKNIRFISTGNPRVDTYLNPEAVTGLEVPITGLMNDRYAAKTSCDIRRTLDHKRRNGEFIGAFAPYGYLKDPSNKNHLVIDEEIAPIKRDMLQWFIREGMSLNGIAHRLNEQGVPNPTAYKRSRGLRYSNPKANENDGMWSGQTVRRVLADQVNLGHMVQGKHRVVSYKVHDQVRVPEEEWFIKENTHEPTFAQEDYDTLMRLLRHDTRTANDSRTVHLFAGFLKCHDCGKALQRKSSKGIVYYACRTYAEKSKTKCSRHSIRLDVLEQAVLAAVRAQIALADSLEGIASELNGIYTANNSTERIEKALRERRRELERTTALTDGLYADWKAGDIDREEYLRMKGKSKERAAHIEEVIARLTEERGQSKEGKVSQADVFDEFQRCGNIQALDRALLIELVETIDVHEGKQVTVALRLADEWKRI